MAKSFTTDNFIETEVLKAEKAGTGGFWATQLQRTMQTSGSSRGRAYEAGYEGWQG